MKKIKVLIVDDSAVVRSILKKELGKRPDLDIIDTAPDPYVARDRILQHEPDVLILDVEMPRMDGITFLEKLMQSKPMPVVIFSSLTPVGCETALRAMELGALEVIHKPSLDVAEKLNEMMEVLANALRAAYSARHRFKDGYKPLVSAVETLSPSTAMIKTTDKVFAIGASTGGTEALRVLLPALPATFPGIVLVQHMPEYFTKTFADSLSKTCAMEVREAKDNETVRQGLILVAPGNHHMLLRRSGARYYVEIKDGPMVFYQRPSVETLFNSVAKYAGSNAVGIILTGMGKDGAGGLKLMKEAGAFTIAQDEATCAVYGMPKAAVDAGAVNKVLPLQDIPKELIRQASKDIHKES
ncbi:MAG: chemotaxis response regulator protein-glutamate methylesterase [Candidatus Omnitrophica bacterium]|nr:chemotaxis response regulator protein-glutamate methylesterase [Candidatus Omnitrophota bacterium]